MRIGSLHMGRLRGLVDEEVVSATHESARIVETSPSSKQLKRVGGDGTRKNTLAATKAFKFRNPMEEHILEGPQM